MKKLNKIMAAVLSGALLAGCNDLDTEPLGSTVTSQQKTETVAVDPSKAIASVTGLAGMMDAVASIVGSDNIGSEQWDFGHPALILMLENRGADMYAINRGYNWFMSELQMSDGLPTSEMTTAMWRYNYNMVRACNSLLKTLDGAFTPEATDEAALKNKFYAAQALGFRAYSYLNLVQSYQFTYAGNETADAVPILTEKNDTEAAVNGAPLATVAEVYDQIVNDLTTAIDYLQGNPNKGTDLVSVKANRFIRLDVALGLRARAYLLMQKWAEAAADAEAAIAATQATPLSFDEAAQPGFNSLEIHNTMWGISVSEEDNTVKTGIINFPSHMGSFSNGYASRVGCWRRINNALFATIPAGDARRGWWLDESATSINLTAEQSDFLAANGALPGTQVKFAPYKGEVGTDLNASDVPLMRVEEMYLILAEATGMTAPAEGAKILADFVKAYRNPTYTFAGTSAEQVQNEVWHQRRIELWGEGFSYFDLLRLKKPLDRRNGGFPAGCIYNVAPDSPILLLPIPQSEINGNPAVTSAVNNNRGGSRPASL